MKDFYQTLGVEKSATAEEIKQAYRKLAMKHHPDRGGDQAEFQAITEAYETLSDTNKRQHYDHQHLRSGFRFQQNFDSVDSIFEQFFNQARRGPRAVQLSVWIGLEDVAVGGDRTINIADQSGQRLINITIPQGVSDGTTVRYPNLGPHNQDLIICFRIHPHRQFTRVNERDLSIDQTVDFWQLIMGSKKTITKLDGGKIEFSIPPRTAPDSTLRLKGQGLTTRVGTGDLLIQIKAQMPREISQEILTAIQNSLNS